MSSKSDKVRKKKWLRHIRAFHGKYEELCREYGIYVTNTIQDDAVLSSEWHDEPDKDGVESHLKDLDETTKDFFKRQK